MCDTCAHAYSFAISVRTFRQMELHATHSLSSIEIRVNVLYVCLIFLGPCLCQRIQMVAYSHIALRHNLCDLKYIICKFDILLRLKVKIDKEKQQTAPAARRRGGGQYVAGTKIKTGIHFISCEVTALYCVLVSIQHRWSVI